MEENFKLMVATDRLNKVGRVVIFSGVARKNNYTFSYILRRYIAAFFEGQVQL